VTSSLPWPRAVACFAAILVIVLGPAFLGPGAKAEDKFRRLTGAQITARFAGMEMSDGVHWRDRYERNGTIASQSMGKDRSGTWRVEANEICVDFGSEQGGCYQVWFSGSKVEFRREGFDGAILEGALQAPVKKR